MPLTVVCVSRLPARTVSVLDISGTAKLIFGSSRMASASDGIKRDDAAPFAAAEIGHVGPHHQQIGPHGRDAAQHRILRAGADGKHRDDGADADDDAEQGEDGAEQVGPERPERHAHGLGDVGDDGGLAGGPGRQRWLGAPDPADIAGNAVGDDQAVADLDDAVGGFGQFRRVGDDDDGMALVVHLPQRRHHFLAALAVERAGRLVGQNDLAAVHQRPGDRHALLLAAGELVGQMIEPVAEPQRASAASRPAPRRVARRHAGIDGGDFDIFLGGCGRHQIVALEDEAEHLPAAGGQLDRRSKPETSSPSSRYWPPVGVSRQPRMFISVDLPEPEAPTMATNSPGWISSETPRSTSTATSPLTKVLRISLSEMSAVIGVRLRTSAACRPCPPRIGAAGRVRPCPTEPVPTTTASFSLEALV